MKEIIFSLFFIILFFPSAHAEESILISRSTTMENIIFDGKWTSKSEWKESVHQMIRFDENKIVHLRTAHHEDYIYFLLDFISDTKLDTNII